MGEKILLVTILFFTFRPFLSKKDISATVPINCFLTKRLYLQLQKHNCRPLAPIASIDSKSFQEKDNEEQRLLKQ